MFDVILILKNPWTKIVFDLQTIKFIFMSFFI